MPFLLITEICSYWIPSLRSQFQVEYVISFVSVTSLHISPAVTNRVPQNTCKSFTKSRLPCSHLIGTNSISQVIQFSCNTYCDFSRRQCQMNEVDRFYALHQKKKLTSFECVTLRIEVSSDRFKGIVWVEFQKCLWDCVSSTLGTHNAHVDPCHREAFSEWGPLRFLQLYRSSLIADVWLPDCLRWNTRGRTTPFLLKVPVDERTMNCLNYRNPKQQHLRREHLSQNHSNCFVLKIVEILSFPLLK